MRAFKKLLKDPIAIAAMVVIILVLFLGLIGPMVAPNDPNLVNATKKFAAPGGQYPLGCDYLGRCVFSRILYGIRPTVIMVLVAMIVNIFIGLMYGMIAGYCKGMVDNVMMRICDILLSFPAEVMILSVIGIFGKGLDKIILALVLLRWPWYARVFRSAVLKYTEKNYVYFAKANGYSTPKILFGNILPAVIPEVVVIASNNMSSLILSISGYSFLGLGIQPPNAEWGMMLSEARNAILSHPEQMLAPGFAIIIVCLAFAFLGDSLRDAMDSKHVRVQKGFFARKKKPVVIGAESLGQSENNV